MKTRGSAAISVVEKVMKETVKAAMIHESLAMTTLTTALTRDHRKALLELAMKLGEAEKALSDARVECVRLFQANELLAEENERLRQQADLAFIDTEVSQPN